ncbi:MAG TPA: hypothetical protein VIO57_04185 [Chloroflexota bacterium]|jgi:hypothetical protein
MHMILHVLVAVPVDERFTTQQICDYTKDEVEAALSRAANDIGTILSVESASWRRVARDAEPLPEMEEKGGP